MLNELNPELNLNIDLEVLKARVKALRIKDESDNIEASRLLGELNNTLAEVEDSEQRKIDYFESQILETKAAIKPVKTEIESLIDAVKLEMLTYRERAKMMINEIKTDIANGTCEKYDMYMDSNGKLISKSALSIRTPEGLSSTRKYFVFSVDDFAKLPDAYKLIDRKKILKDLKKGITIPGVKHEQKEAMQYRGNKAKAA